MSRYLTSESRTIPADAQTLFDIVADPAMHPVIDGSGSVRAVRGESTRLAKGSTFGMDMKIGTSYKITNTVVEFDEGRLIAWRHFNGHVWRYRFEPTGDGSTKVTEEWDLRPVWNRAMLKLAFGARTKKALVATLSRLDEVAAERR